MRLAVFTKNRSNPAYTAARLGAERAAQVFGAEVLHFVPETPDDPAQQCALIDEALARSPRPDAFVLSPVHPHAVDAALQRVQAAGIPIIGFVSPITAVSCVSFVSSDDYALATAIAEHLFAHLRSQGRVLVVGGHAGSHTSEERLRGFADAARAHPGIVLAGAVAGDYARDVARSRTRDWLRANAPVAACLVANDIMALGVLDALADAGREAVVVGVNAIPDAITAIAEGRMLATADFNAMQMAYLATECAVRHLRGETVPAQVALPVDIVHHGNCAAWNKPYAERPIVTLAEWREHSR